MNYSSIIFFSLSQGWMQRDCSCVIFGSVDPQVFDPRNTWLCVDVDPINSSHGVRRVRQDLGTEVGDAKCPAIPICLLPLPGVFPSWIYDSDLLFDIYGMEKRGNSVFCVGMTHLRWPDATSVTFTHAYKGIFHSYPFILYNLPHHSIFKGCGRGELIIVKTTSSTSTFGQPPSACVLPPTTISPSSHMSDISQLSLEDCADGKFYSLPVAQIQGDDTLGSAQPLTLRGDREPPGYTFETIHTHEMRKLNIHGRDIQRGSWSSEGIAIVTGGSLMDGFEHVEQEEVSSIARESTADFCSLRAVVTSKSLSYPFDEYERENRFRRPLNRGSMESTKRCVGDWTPPMTSRKTVTRYRGALSTVSPFPFNSAPGSYRGERRKSWSGALPSIEHVAQANREPFHQSQAELRLKIYASAVSAPP